MTIARLRRRYLALLAMRWLPTGLLIPVLVLLLLDRGISIAEIGLASAAQGVMVMVLELPTGALADTYGRRVVLAWASLFELMSIGLLLVADSLALLAAVFALQGIFRALESGPLDAWFVDSAQSVDPTTDIEAVLAAAGAVLGLSIAAATVAAGLLVAADPITAVDPLVVPLLASLALRGLHLVAIAALMDDVAVRRPPAHPVPGGALHKPQSVGTVMVGALGLIRSNPMLRALMVVELLWGAGMIAFETLTPARLEEVAGQAERAATVFGPATAAAWVASAAAAAAVPRLAGLIGPARTGALLRVAQGVTVAGIGLASGVVGVVIAFLVTMAVHGAANPVHQGLLHRSVEGSANRSTIVSANSLSAQMGGAIGMVTLTALADATTRSTAIIAGALVLALAAPLYLLGSGT